MAKETAVMNRQEILTKVATKASEMSVREEDFQKASLTQLNKEAVSYFKSGDYIGSIAAYERVFRRVRENNITHKQLHVCYSNRSAAYFHLGLYEEALADAEKCKTLAEFYIQRSGEYCPSYVKSYIRKGAALLSLGRYREASTAFNEGLEIDPSNCDLRIGLEQATHQILDDLLRGKGKEIRCLPSADTCKKISSFAYSTPLHKIKIESVLPHTLLTSQQAERDHHIRDTYNYVTIQTDIHMPLRYIARLKDEKRCELFSEAVMRAIKRTISKVMEPRLLSLGGGSGLLSMVALKQGAKHVTAVERWLYLAQSCKETFELNGFAPEQYKVVYKRPTDITLKEDIPICCNICVNEILDEGLLTSGIIPAFRHCLDNILIPDCILIPSSATVFAQAIEFRTGDVCGFDMSAVNQYRWHPFFTCGLPLNTECYTTLSAPFEVWHFDFYHPPEETSHKTLDLTFTHKGIFNAVLFWYELDLGDNLTFSTFSENSQERRLSSLQPCVQFLAGELEVEEGAVYPLVCSHNTVRLRFDIEEAAYLHLTKQDLSFPYSNLSFLKCETVIEAYATAIKNAYRKAKDRDRRVDALNIGCGTGVLALICAKAGCSSVVACDVHSSACDIARKAIARNNCSSSISVVCEDIASLRRGQSIRYNGANLVVFELFDPALVGHHILGLIDCLHRHVLQHNALTVPQKAVIYCMGVELTTKNVGGFNFRSLDKYRWNEEYDAVRLSDEPYKQLTAPVKAFEFHLNSEQSGRGRETLVRLDVQSNGSLNAVVLWFDLYLDEETVITTAPRGISVGGKQSTLSDNAEIRVEDSRQRTSKEQTPYSSLNTSTNFYEDDGHHWGQALYYLDSSIEVSAGSRALLVARRDGNKIHFRTKHGVGVPVEKAPWKVQWGGGASVENPHFQRVHYCQLLINDFKMRCKGSRHPSISEDLQIMFNHCGSLFLDPHTLSLIAQDLMNTEKLCQRKDPCPSATPQSILGTPLFHA